MAHCFTATLVSRGITLKDNESAILYTISRRIILKVKEITVLYTIHNCVWAALSTGPSEEYVLSYNLGMAVSTITIQEEIIS